MAELTIPAYVQQCRHEAEEARRVRLDRNKVNRDAFLNRQDWTHKEAGQATHFLPKTAVAVESHTSLAKSALTSFTNWFEAQLPMYADQMGLERDVPRQLLKSYLRRLWTGGTQGDTEFGLIFSDALRIALLECLMIFKVGGQMVNGVWRPTLNIVNPEDYYPDPTGAGLYELHRYEMDFQKMVDLGESGYYDKQAVLALVGQDQEKDYHEKRREEAKDQQEHRRPGFRKRVVIDEFWGDILDPNGLITHRNAMVVIANDRFVLRGPIPNPWWHGKSPFVASPIVRIAGSVWHRSLMDEAVQINLVINELLNLIVDGGISSVWGINEIRMDFLENPQDVASGIKQGQTIAINGQAPPGVPALTQVASGQVPGEAVSVFQILEQQFAEAALTNELRSGNLPQASQSATAVLEAQQGISTTLKGIYGDIERNTIVPLLHRMWSNLVQHLDRLNGDDVVEAIGANNVASLYRVPKEQRQQLLTQVNLKVRGLTEMLARGQDFQKFSALQQVLSSNPQLLQFASENLSPRRTVDTLYKMLLLDASDFEMSPDERANLPGTLATMPEYAQMTSGGGRVSDAGVNQLSAPLSGLGG